jgi:ATP-dependent helicase/nuclease subunit B
MTDSSSLKIYNIAAGQPFLDVLATSLSTQETRAALFGPVALEDITILLPTRRAARELARLLLAAAEKNGQEAILLPQISTLGDLDDEDFEAGLLAGTPSAALSLPPAIDPRARHFIFQRFIQKWAEISNQDLSAVGLSALAYDLERFLDQAQSEQINWDELPSLAPDELAENWQQTLAFLKIITDAWPEYLHQTGQLDPVERRNQLLAAQVQKWREAPPQGPVIAAGSTGSIRATADLLEVIAGLPQGAVILPGLDMQADDACWRAIEDDPAHPQMSMAGLLKAMGVTRADVRAWPQSGDAAPMAQLINQALVPVPQTADWVHRAGDMAALKLTHCSLIEAPDQRSEAGAVALAMREVYETPGKTAALVTRDRRLARRVASELRRWNIEVDDSAGQPLNQTAAASLLRLILQCHKENFAPVALLALLKHPMVALGASRGQHLAAVRKMETQVLRGPRPAAGLAGLQATLVMNKQPESPLLKGLEAAFAPLLGVRDPAPLSALVPALLTCAEALIRTAAADHLPLFDNGDDGRALKPFFDSLMAQAEHAADIRLADWPELFDLWLSQNTLRRLPRRTPRLYIWGPLEARLMQPDVVILGGLNEASWPPLPETGPWLSRPMREKIGLSLPERQIGLAAHDFAQAASAPRVLLSRAIKIDGTPSVAARWLRRLETLCHGLPRDDGDRLLGWWASLDGMPGDLDTLASARPNPCPPVAVRPTSLSVTQIETLIFDPYKIYARKILGLRELEPVDAPASAAHRGSLIHYLFEKLIRDKRHLGDTIAEDLLAYAEQMKVEMPGGASVMQFWQARLEAMAEWFETYEGDRRSDISDTIAEEFGRLTMDIGGQDFTVTAKADRIDRLKDKSYVVIDYKTGQAPSKKRVEQHFAPQLSLTAAILQNGGFAAAGLPAGMVRSLDYVKLTGRSPAGEVTSISPDDALIDGALDMVRGLMASYQDAAQGYGSHIRSRSNTFTSAYDHLARLAEWRSTLEHEEEAP